MLKVLLNETMSALTVFIEHCTEYPNHCRSTRIKDIRSLLLRLKTVTISENIMYTLQIKRI